MERINTTQISQLRFYEQSAEESLIPHLIKIFDEQHQTLIPRMRDLCLRGELTTLSETAHKLKSSAAQLGLVTVESLCLRLETEGRRKTAYNFLEAMTHLEEECKLSLEELERYLENASPVRLAS